MLGQTVILRTDKVKLSDVGPESRWENGDLWMQGEISDAIESGVLKPATSLRVSKDMENEFKEGLMFGDRDEVLAGCCNSNISGKVSELRKSKLEERAGFSKYIILPTKYSFPKTVRIYGYVLCFIKKARKGRRLMGRLLTESELWFTMFKSEQLSHHKQTLIVHTEENMISGDCKTKVMNHFTIKKLCLQNTDRVQGVCTVRGRPPPCLTLPLQEVFSRGQEV